jgi:hypothetical protein
MANLELERKDLYRENLKKTLYNFFTFFCGGKKSRKMFFLQNFKILNFLHKLESVYGILLVQHTR